MCRSVRRQRRAERDGHGIGETFRHFPEEAATVEAEDAAPHTVEVNRDDRRRPSLHDAFEPPSERQQRSGARDLAFGKNADQLSLVEGGTGFTERTQDDPQASMGGNRE